MKMTHRDYSDQVGDLTRLCRLVVALRHEAWQQTTWCIGRMVDWKYGVWGSKLDAPNFCERNAHLWFDAFGDLAGVVISENGDSTIAILTLPGYRFLFAELLDWALTAWADRGPHFAIEITEHQQLETRVLERHGFQGNAPFCTRRFDLSQLLEQRFPLDPGFTIVDMLSHPDYRGRRIVRANAFSKQEILDDDELRHELLLDTIGRGSPIYHPECDLYVLAPDGQLVAGCEALIDAANAEADIERVCTHSAFRKRGFARAVIQECMYRLRDMGMRRAYITGYSDAAIALYGSLGPMEELHSVIYTRGTTIEKSVSHPDG